ncbi:lactate dehydrogenase [Nanchangia anserum]|nr:NAD(P)-dependent oxidoreductase [Nanchangia anserum]QOX81573.1 lactate dehydrogenase [Nanchangia anserum]
MMLMVLRKIRPMLRRFDAQDFRTDGLEGGELAGRTVGIIGAGNIGATLARCLSGFGCEILATDPYPRPDLDTIVTYVDLDELLRRSDVVTIHMALSEQTRHLIDRDALAQMKPDAILINCARGPMVDTAALVDALAEGRLAGAGLDVVEGEEAFSYRDLPTHIVDDVAFARLRAMPNVVVTSHMAYLTREVVRETVQRGFGHALMFAAGEDVPFEIALPDVAD